MSLFIFVIQNRLLALSHLKSGIRGSKNFRKMYKQFYMKGSCHYFLNLLRVVNITGNFNYSVHILSCSYGYLTDGQILSCLRLIKFLFKNSDLFVFVRVYPRIFLTKKPSEVRMGKGKGNILCSVICPVRPGKVIFSFSGFNAVSFQKDIFFSLKRRLNSRLRCSVKFCFSDFCRFE